MKRRYFGTDGVRGAFGGPVINPEFAARLAEAAARWTGGEQAVLVGRDTRDSGVALLDGLVAGFAAVGWTVVDLGVVPTPAVARAVRTRENPLGVVLTASHNPATDNGIKFFGPGGIKLSDEQEAAIEALLPTQSATTTGEVEKSFDVLEAYLRDLAAYRPDGGLAGWKIVVDTANGATTQTTPFLLERFGAEVIRIGATPNGHNINAGVGSEHPGAMAEQVVASGAALGVAHDGDGDRCVLCDETGAVLDGDEILTILACDGLRSKTLQNNTLVVTEQSNLGVDAVIKSAGGTVLRTSIGDRYVAERMRAVGASLGGESSGHIICDEIGPTGDGLGAALKILQVMRSSGKPLSELRRRLQKFPQQVGAIAVAQKRPLADCPHLASAIVELEAELGDKGRLLVRYSGTEPKLRLLVEGSTPEVVAATYERLERAAQRDLSS
jgi:phosphoglucosamine mutase